MFILVKLSDTIRIAPDQFNVPQVEAISEELNGRLANKVIVNVGLCICLHNIVKVGESFLYHGDGASHAKVEFRFIVFRPFVGEVIVGKIRSCSREGVLVSLGFFDDILVPPEYLQEPCRFDEKEQLWVWEYPDDDAEGTKHDMFMDVGEKIRFKVKEEIFKDTSPPGPTGPNADPETKRKIPYFIKGTVSESGLGLVSWWM